MALYDLAAPVRSKAVTVLTDFDHESVFEGILLACADPTREVRATAARGLFRLSFDRADAWKRIMETRDGFRMRHAARAAIEAGIVTKAFDRLIHDDHKIAYEAVVLVALMIEAGETKEIFEAIRSHKDERVRYALLHVLKMMQDDRTQEDLVELAKAEDLPADVMTRVKEAVKVFEQVAA
jgi:HEAT repeat protein